MYVVTGGAGLIGSAIVWALNKASINDIIVVDNLVSSEKWKNLRALRFEDYIEKDVFRRHVAERRFGELEGIIHMGACSATTEKNASYLADNNYNYTKELAEFAVSNRIRFVYASSAATYGEGERGYSDNADPHTLRPMNMYGYSKHMFDLWAQKRGLLGKITGLKFFNIFGPNEHHKGDMRSVVHKAFEQVRDGGRISLFKSHRPEYADGEQKRDFFYVKDAADIVLHLLNKNAPGVYNVGSGQARSWNDLARAIFAAMGREPRIDYVDMPEHLRDRYQYFTQAETAKLLSTGCSKKPMSLEDAVKDYVQNYLIPGKYLGEE